MIKHVLIGTAALAATAILTGGIAAPAGAEDEFGQHVQRCAQTMGFDGEHNPGTHEGAHGWSPDHTC
jgi:hypothetical protein